MDFRRDWFNAIIGLFPSVLMSVFRLIICIKTNIVVVEMSAVRIVIF